MGWGRTAQEHVEPVMLELLSDGRSRSTAEINVAVKAALPPNPLDRVGANKRLNESKYDAIIPNAVEKGRGLSKQGLIERDAAGLIRATPAGIAVAASFRKQVGEMRRDLEDVFSEDCWQ